jgi:hypothetical protein
MKSFVENFVSAWRVSTPLISVRTSDAASTIANIRKAVTTHAKKTESKNEDATIPFISWDAINGLRGLDSAGKGATFIADIVAKGQIDIGATTQLPIALQVLALAGNNNVICFVHNIHLFWADPLVLQGIWNCRDTYKANGNMLVLLTVLGTVLPPELNNDVLALEEPLPTRTELKQIVKECFGFANAKEPSENIYDKAADALVGIAAFPSDQATAMSLDKKTCKLDIPALWARKRAIVSACPGLSFYTGPETLVDAGGLSNIKNYITAIMKGKRSAKVILRVDEIEKAFAGAGTDTSGVKGDLLGNFLSWVEDKKVLCMLFVGVPGASKSHIIYCAGGEFEIPVINFDIAGMQDSLVGNSGKNLRNAEVVVEAISDGQILLCATANSLRGLPAELISRFEKGGIFFFDAPTAEERQVILELKIRKYNLSPEQTAESPDLTDFTGREIDSMCDKADMMNCSLSDAVQYVVPLMRSHSESMSELRQSAHNRFLSASHKGLYTYTKPEAIVHKPTVVTTGRKMRD